MSQPDTIAKRPEPVLAVKPTPYDGGTLQEPIKPASAVGQATGHSNGSGTRPTGKSVVLNESLRTRFGGRIGKYELVAQVGRGGMGLVFKAFDPDLKRTIALKVLVSGVDANADEVARFHSEAETVANLQHPNIVQIFEILSHEQGPVLALEFVDGGTLADKTQGCPQQPRQSAIWLETLARAVHAAHLKGIIHRDLKPGNIMMASDGTLKVTDFGLAKRLDHSLALSNDGDVMGTPSYMSPEQASGRTKDIDPRTDIYSLGAIFYELLTGRPPFRGATLIDTLEQIRQNDPAPPSRLVPKLPPALSIICLKCLEKSPSSRFESAEALADELKRWLDGEKIKTKPIGTLQRAIRFVRRKPALTAQVVSGVVVIALLVLVIVMQREYGMQEEINRQRERVNEEKARTEREKADHFGRSAKALDEILALLVDDEKISKISGLENMHSKLLGFYDQIGEQENSGDTGADRVADGTVERLAIAYSKLGKLMRRSGHSDLAERAFQKSLAFYGRLLEQDAEHADWLHGKAKVMIQIAVMEQRDMGRLKTGAEKAIAAQKILEHVLELAKSNLVGTDGKPLVDPRSVRNDLAETWHQLGEIHNADNEQAKSIAAYEEAVKIREKLVQEADSEKQFRRDLARSYGYIGDVYLDAARIAEADSAYWASHRHREKLAEATAKSDTALRSEYQFQLARSWGNFGAMQLHLGSFDTALHFYDNTLKLQEILADENKANKDFANDYAGTLNRFGEIYCQKASFEHFNLKPRSLSKAEEYLDKARLRYIRLFEADPSWVPPKRGRAETEVLMIKVQLEKSDNVRPDANMISSLTSAEASLKDLYRLNNKDGNLIYLLACTAGLRAEFAATFEQSSETAKAEAMKNLQEAISRANFSKHPQAVRSDRAFKVIAAEKEFTQLIDRYQEKFLGSR